MKDDNRRQIKGHLAAINDVLEHDRRHEQLSTQDLFRNALGRKLTVCYDLCNELLGRAGFNLRDRLNHEMGHALGRHIAAAYDFTVTPERPEPGSPEFYRCRDGFLTRFRAEVYVFDAAQLRTLIERAYRAGQGR